MIAVTGGGPTFLGIGAQKAGTTWLHRMLCLHPDIGMPEQKELHFWDRDEPVAAAIGTYRHIFDDLHGKARGEITPSYAILPPDRIALMKRHFPDLRLIYILRNPIERAWSQARMELAKHINKHGQPPEDMETWLRQQLSSPESVMRGDYAVCLENWYTHYGRGQIKIFIYEEAFAEPQRFLQECCKYLEVDPNYYSNVLDETLTDPILPEKMILKIERVVLQDKLKVNQLDMLQALYAPRIKALSRLLNRDLTDNWLCE
ncbi:MAG TPA: sulfotransferase [Gammaproteobacteria bacterium]|nr:sulfotransferase [Gammaproteobacteria bacterium]